MLRSGKLSGAISAVALTRRKRPAMSNFDEILEQVFQQIIADNAMTPEQLGGDETRPAAHIRKSSSASTSHASPRCVPPAESTHTAVILHFLGVRCSMSARPISE
jgi:hypothetical protein